MNQNTNSVLDKITFAYNKHKLRKYKENVKKIKTFRFETWKKNRMKQRSLTLMQQAKSGTSLEELLIEAYALVYETVKRVLGFQLFDEQLIAGMALHEGKVIEMQTGEGKTVAAVLPAYLNALLGKGVHILTFNDYLATRDAKWMGVIYNYLGLSVGFIKEGMDKKARKEAYDADITYLTAKEAGFDYLKDSICYDNKSIVHRPFHFALVDEADSILIDEARVPLVIADKESTSQEDRKQFTAIIRNLQQGIDYATDENERNVYLTELGIKKAEQLLSCENLFRNENVDTMASLHCALHAEVLLKRDIHYIIRGGRIELIDELTGRIADKRHWPDGLQAAVEAKEELNIQSSGKILGSITLHNFLNLYPKISGMTATANSSINEFTEIYNLEVITVPSHKTCLRTDYPHCVFTHKEAKQKALVKEIKTVHLTGRPILIGTSSVEESNNLAINLNATGIQCNVLNAKNDELEAEIISQAGRLGAVTVSTNMAGRGVDILLGGGCADEYEKVVGFGGLYVIGTNLHESSRIDNQLRGRAGRQGDPGATKFFISLEDDLLIRFGISKVIPPKHRTLKQDTPLTSSKVIQKIDHIQRVVDGENFEIRKTLNKYSDILEQQRCIILKKRHDILLDRAVGNLFSTKEPEKYENLCKQLGKTKMHHIEKRITLLQIDLCWAEHLDYIEYIREGIHLESVAKKNPLDEFHKLLISAFDKLSDKIEQGMMNQFHAIVPKKEINMEMKILKHPSATWTYIVNDNFVTRKDSLFKLL
ncbi:accessory Sec system translocase SecA2 [Cytobacillus sp. IB215665]|uniref:accessory Sec system translocase SecA2 n=1 Tax=Cytobacillus sp. IB215665 TaxID=3097357 RepID=UPI002A14B00E|nr:accessory Sec system translocase SecA2 [Cytobacillus sp. IB215665]MDX8364712.1 accessory Sec system translocase SecA2 [Cytobacillus sp. IB215665]